MINKNKKDKTDNKTKDKTKGQLTIEFLLMAAIFLAIISVLLYQQSEISKKLISFLNSTDYSTKAKDVSILYSIKELNNPDMRYESPQILRLVREGKCIIGEPYVVCGPLGEGFSTQIYIWRTDIDEYETV